MNTIHLPYLYPHIVTLQQDILQVMDQPTAAVTADWNRFEHNIQHLLPDQDRYAYLLHYAEACLNQQMASQESHCPQLERLLMQLPLPEGYLRRPGIITTMHYASYRIICKWLAAQHIPFVLLVASDVLKEQELLFVRQLEGVLQDKRNFRVMDAEKPSTVLQMRKAIAEGFYVLAYLDGAKGTHEQASEKNSCSLTLGNAQIRVRTGLAYIATWMGVPLYPMWTSRDENGILLRYAEPIIPNHSQRSKLEESKRCTELMFRLFFSDIKTCLSWWEPCFYLDEAFI